MRVRILKTILTVSIAILFIIPIALYLSAHSTPAQKDAAHVIEPMITLLDQGPQHAAVPVEPAIDIEDCWDIEDNRLESDVPLVAAMRSDTSVLGFDAQNNTFYCTIGMNTEEFWPELALYAQSAQQDDSLRVAWVDSYDYDYCSDAVREGYRYELIAYTDTAYAYFGIVFTGLPIITVHVEENAEFSEEYIPARFSVSSADHDLILSPGQVHLRSGGVKKAIDKFSYRLEFHTLDSGIDAKHSVSPLGMEADTDWILLANAQDPTAVRNALCFDMWHRWNAGSPAPNMLENRMVEVFVQDEYMGLYQLIQRIDPKKELTRIGGNPDTDSVVRVIGFSNIGEKPTLNLPEAAPKWVEYRYDGQNQPMRAFSRYMDYARLNLRDFHSLASGSFLSDDEFIALAQECVPVEEILSFFLFTQVCNLSDNVFNNLYVWAVNSGDTVKYYLSPWDMDWSLNTPLTEDDTIPTSIELSMYLPCRMLDLDALDSRRIVSQIWQERSEQLLTSEEIYNWIIGMEEMINASGAYLRESEKWYGEAQPLNLADIAFYTESRIENIGYALLDMWPVEESF